MRAVFAVACLALLTACASLSEEECLSGDWGGIGQRDGASGRVAETQFARHVKACKKVGVTPARTDWQTGYARGLQSYCTPSKGLDEGLAGRRYRNVCPAATQAGFLRGFRIGTDDYQARQEVRRLQSEIDSLRARNTQIRAVLADADDAALRTELRRNRSALLRLHLDLGFARADAARTRRAVRNFSPG